MVNIVDSYEVGSFEVVFNKANHAAAPLVPSIAVPWTFAVINLKFVFIYI